MAKRYLKNIYIEQLSYSDNLIKTDKEVIVISLAQHQEKVKERKQPMFINMHRDKTLQLEAKGKYFKRNIPIHKT